MYRASALVLMVSAVVLAAGTASAGAPVCRPALAVKSVRFSEMQSLRRIWTASLAVDASRCAATSGRFDMNFVRLTEIGPDLSFTERFTWIPGELEVSVVFAADEAVLDYSIGYIASCACRE